MYQLPLVALVTCKRPKNMYLLFQRNNKTTKSNYGNLLLLVLSQVPFVKHSP